MCIVQFVAERNPWSEEELRFLQHKFQHLERPPNFPEIRMAICVVVHLYATEHSHR